MVDLSIVLLNNKFDLSIVFDCSIVQLIDKVDVRIIDKPGLEDEKNRKNLVS